jgi:UDP-GlcNAc:undecaprenyl-phosphate GlcNAc-1-phosphate transferase
MLLSIFASIATTLVALVVLRRFAPRLGLMALPGGHSVHEVATPVVGGLGMLAGLGTAWLVSDAIQSNIATALGATGLVMIGLWDDRHGLGAGSKFTAQAVIVTLALWFDQEVLHSLGGLLPGMELRLGILALPFTVFAVLGLINALNMIDGLDGLAGKVALSICAILALGLWMVGATHRLATALALIGVISAFLLFNARFPWRRRALLFMGDTGSMLLGYLVAVAAIKATQRAPGIPPITALWICGLPIIDTLSVMVRRIRQGRPAMTGAQDHLHHLLHARGLSVGKVGIAEAALALLLGLIGVAGWRFGIPQWVMFALFLITLFTFHLACQRAWAGIQTRHTSRVVEIHPAQAPSS